MRTQQIWFVVNRDNQVMMFLEEPQKNEIQGKWFGKKPYINSKLYNEICGLVQQSSMTFETEPQCVEIQFSFKDKIEED